MRLALNGRFYTAPVTGVQRFAREIALRLCLREEVTLFLPAGVAVPPELGEVPVVRGRLRGHAWEQLELPAAMARAACEVELHLAGTAPRCGARSVAVVHDVLPLTDPHWFGRRFRFWRRTVLRRALPSAARVLTVSRWSREEIARVLPVQRARIEIVSQGLDPFTAPASPERVAAVRARHELVGPYLLALGAGDPRKNVAFLQGVLARWREALAPAPRLVVVGEPAARLFPGTGAARPSLPWRRPDASATRPSGRGASAASGGGVLHLGRVDDAELHALYTGAAAFCFPALAEGFGRPPLEAMACATPAIVADYGPAREVLGRGARILPLEPDAWVSALAELIHQGPAREALVERGRAWARRYRWDTAAQQVRAACETVAVLAGARARAARAATGAGAVLAGRRGGR
jgi:glycosyltransferase involved in cell wall biosynthesis